MTQHEYSHFKQDIMKQVYRRYWLRMALHPLILETGVLAVVFMCMSLIVSFKDIFMNAFAMSANATKLSHFFIQAFMTTDRGVKILCLFSIVALMVWAYEILRQVSRKVFRTYA
jgi:hypothetical protein